MADVDREEPSESFDLQVNGYGGVDFNADGLMPAEFEKACRLLSNDGCTGFLPTIITDSIATMQSRISAVCEAARQLPEDLRHIVAGIHVEGPFLNPSDGTAGAHPRQHICEADIELMKLLIDASQGSIRLVTLAPECDERFRLTSFLADQGIVVSAGHCDPDLDTLKAAADHGLSMFTHVGNGCSLMQNRHDNIVQRVLSLSDHLWCCWIADGIHVPPFALKNYLQVAGIDRSIVVTDAMTAAGLGPGEYTLGSQAVIVDEAYRAMLPGSDGRLAGSVATVDWLRRVLKDDLLLPNEDISRMMFHNPRKALGLV